MRIQSKDKNTITKKNIAILSTCIDDWGGSEELWALSVPYLQKDGFSITVLKNHINYEHKRIEELKKSGVRFKKLTKKYNKVSKRLINAYYQIVNPYQEVYFKAFDKFLRNQKPQLVIISQAINFDGLYYANLCLKHKIKYVIIAQKAVEFYWPPRNERTLMTRVINNAKKFYFVSEHNKNLTEEQFGLRFKNAEIIYNPNKLNVKPLEYPPTELGFKLALIGRLFIIDKGQDILFRILAKEKWRKRKLYVSLIGSGPDLGALKNMAHLFNLENVEFSGFQNDINQVWLSHHALVLPSRSEGLPLVVIEAMAAGRTIIATRAGGTMELVKDEVTGFIGDATENSFEQALEKAWNERLRWETMGVEASKFIKKLMPIDAEIDFANKIMSLIHE